MTNGWYFPEEEPAAPPRGRLDPCLDCGPTSPHLRLDHEPQRQPRPSGWEETSGPLADGQAGDMVWPA